MKVTGIYLLATSAVIGAKAQVSIDCFGIDSSGVNGFGKGCVEEVNPTRSCMDNDSACENSNVGYNECLDEGPNITNTCVCIIPNFEVSSNTCNGNFGTNAEKPCCFEG